MQLERRRDLADGRQGRFEAACRLGRDLPRKPKATNPRGFGGQSPPDSINQTLNKPRNSCPLFRGKCKTLAFRKLWYR